MTLREIHERCKRRHFDHMTVNEQSGAPFDLCDACDMPWPCPDYQDALAALAILDAAETWKRPAEPDYTGIAWRDRAGSLRLVPDPEPSA